VANTDDLIPDLPALPPGSEFSYLEGRLHEIFAPMNDADIPGQRCGSVNASGAPSAKGRRWWPSSTPTWPSSTNRVWVGQAPRRGLAMRLALLGRQGPQIHCRLASRRTRQLASRTVEAGGFR